MSARRLVWGVLLLLAACPGNKDNGTLTTVGPGTGTNPLPDGGTRPPGNVSGDGDAPNIGDGDAASLGDGGVVDLTQPIVIDDCKSGSAGLTDTQIGALKAGGNASGLRLLYPYDGTAFPRGLEGPLMMWDGVQSTDVVYVHIKSSSFEYSGCLKPTDTNTLQLAKDVWDQAGTKAFGKRDPYAVEVSVLSGGQVYGPVKQQWIIAQATLKGSIYYNSYISSTYPGGRVYRIPAGGKFEPFVTDQVCVGCHSVSANGDRMTTQLLYSGGPSYNLETGKAVALAGQATSAFTALFPDGSVYVRPSLAREVARSVLTSAAAVATSGTDAQLYETDTGKQVQASGLPKGALMPSFSPDGKLLVFTDNDADDAHSLGTVQFDSTKHSFSGYKKIYTDPSENRPGWPFVLPDDKAALFVRSKDGDWSAQGAGVVAASLTGLAAPYSELFMVNLDSGKSTILARAMGYNTAADATAKKSYLPFGAEDTEHVYFPTVSPVAAGGFFWVFFDSIRHYGNKGRQRQLWGTAIEISPDGDYSVDRSYPAFYLPGQEFGTGNHRAFTALDPCKEDGASCTSGVDCCGGFCTLPDGVTEFSAGVTGTCSSAPKQCAHTDEKCTQNSDCCAPTGNDTANSCINGFCAPVVVL